MNPTLFTIGYSTHSMDEFLALLARHQVQAVADVRSQPFSRRSPCFSRPALERDLQSAGLLYVFLGRELGARREERSCYIDHAVCYERVAATPAFLNGLERLKTGLLKYRVALLCAERDPLDCHRSLLISRHAARFASVAHILADGSLETHAEAEARLLRRFEWNQEELFCSREDRLAEAYARRGRELAWTDPNSAPFAAL